MAARALLGERQTEDLEVFGSNSGRGKMAYLKKYVISYEAYLTHPLSPNGVLFANNKWHYCLVTLRSYHLFNMNGKTST